MIRKFFSKILLSVLIFSSCAPNPSGGFFPLSQQQPKVLEVQPAADSRLDNPVHFLVRFSEIPLDKGRYYLAVTPRLISVKGIPFNQDPGASPQAFYAAYGLGISVAPGGEDENFFPPNEFGPSPEILMINEILYDGKLSETDGESFIELYGSAGADISDYEIALINGADGETTDRIFLPSGSILNADGIFVVADLRTNSRDQTQVAFYDFLDQFDPQNGPDGVQLLDRNGKLLDAVCYGEGSVNQTPQGLPLCEGDPAPDVTAGHSLSRHNGLDTQDNQLDFFENESPSPGNP
jgi:hypothetical protein